MDHETPVRTQARRRTTYGLNVTIAIVAAVGIAVLINWIVYRSAWKMDFSAGRKYTLAPQTLNLLKDLKEDYEVVTLFNDTPELSPQMTRARDLVGEYARYSPHMRVEHVNVSFEPQRYEEFLVRLRDRYEKALQPLRQAIQQAMEATRQVGSDIAQHMEPLKQVLEHPQFTDAGARRSVEEMARVFLTCRHELEQMQTAFEQAMSGTLPNYAAVRADLSQNISTLATNVYGIAIERFERAVREPSVPADVKETLLRSIDSFKATLEQLQGAMASLQDVKPVGDYDKLLSDLKRENPVVLVGPDEVRVVPLHEMFRDTAAQASEGQQTEPAFQGEERLTGALVSMTLENPPLVVFVTDNTVAPIGRGGNPMMLFNDVAQRLHNMNFQVEQWSPAGGRGPQGQPAAPLPPPQPKAGQKAVWVITGATPVDPRNPMAANYRDEVASQLTQRLEAGDSALVMFACLDSGQFGQTDPVASAIAGWGITPQLDRVIFQEIAVPNRPAVAVPQFVVAKWPGDLPISAAVEGMPGAFVLASPLIVGKPTIEGAKTHVLAQLQGDRLWGEQNFASSEMKYNPGNAADTFTVAAAAEGKNSRLIVVADPFFASDYCTTNADPRLSPNNAGTARFFGAAYPANAELFVNSVYWLSDLDILIAASARTQDIRRIKIEPDSVPALQKTLLAGLPLGTLVIGLGVWFARRRE